ncbi:plastocyanin/azurin family copper-binding protein (plasmid) [Deinococcus radiomollis]|uniref:plastocyanin/azurin family copper-binding protein n=1 Tax=Deinococcus radiomollis TaxID=468916 RepID=UPI003891FB41
MQKKMLAGAAVLGFSLLFVGGQVQAQGAAKPQVVAVKLSEWTMGMMDMKVKGPVQFDIVNEGKYPHVFTLEGKIGDQSIAVSSILLKANEKTSLTLSLPAGTYTVYCPLPGHADKGMKGTLTVQ